MGANATVWQQDKLVSKFLSGIRGAIPFAADHMRLMLDVLATGRKVQRLLDVGCGDGVLSEAVLSRWPDAELVLVDFSTPMLEAAKRRFGQRATYHQRDFADPQWTAGLGEFDAVISGLAIHHQPDPRKVEVYRAIHNLLRPGGWFVHLEHVASGSPTSEYLAHEHLVDALYAYHRKTDPAVDREQLRQQYVDRDDRDANILTLVWTQLDWLREIGYVDVDCFFKCYELALFGGRKVDAP